ncbi:hypothetical protein LIER_43313 [Lithospermum erythrorhizon]|uniref:Uncharacterized protein n=1 Tax=Lithospermum erythrorhizon TaxID=34254 RepID=A0AAV3PVB2_LITER
MGQTVDNPPEGCFAVYKIMLEYGLRLPAKEILATVGQAPAQVIYNSWVVLTAFQVACHVAAVKTSVDLFQYMYKIATSNRDYIYFSQRDNKNLTLLNLTKKGKWEPYFFFVSANAFGEKVPSHFCVKTVNFKCNPLDIELEFLKLRKNFTRLLLLDAYLDEEVLLSCNIYKDANKRPKEDAYVLLLKVNDALVQSAISKNNQSVLKLIADENLPSGIHVEVSDVSIAFKPSEPDTKVDLSTKVGGATSSTAKISPRPLEITSNNESNDLPTATRFPFVSSRVKIEKVSTLDANGDEDVEIIDIDKFLESKKKSSPSMTPSDRSSVPAAAWLKTSAGKRQSETIPEYPFILRRKGQTMSVQLKVSGN